MKKVHKSKSVGRPSRTCGRSQSVREHFLDTAIRLFAERGVPGTSIARIAAEVEVTPAMGHYYFSSREKLLDAVAAERIFPFIRYAWKDFDTENETLPAERGGIIPALERLIERLVEITRNSPWVPELWVGEVLNPAGTFRKRVFTYLNQRHLPAYEQAFARAQANGEISSSLDARLVLISILSSVMLPQALIDISQQKPTGEEQKFLEQVAAHAKTLLLHGLSLNQETSRPGPFESTLHLNQLFKV